MSMKNNEQVMMEADYSPGDEKLVSEARGKSYPATPQIGRIHFVDVVKFCKQTRLERLLSKTKPIL